MKGKKAQAGELVQDTVCLIIIAFLIFMLFAVGGAAWGWSKKEVKSLTKEHSMTGQAHHSLHIWLQQPVQVEIEGKKESISIAELIKLSSIDSSYKTVLDSEMHKAFDPFYNYNFKHTTKELEAEIRALETYPHFYIPSNKTILTVLQINKIK